MALISACRYIALGFFENFSAKGWVLDSGKPTPKTVRFLVTIAAIFHRDLKSTFAIHLCINIDINSTPFYKGLIMTRLVILYTTIIPCYLEGVKVAGLPSFHTRFHPIYNNNVVQSYTVMYGLILKMGVFKIGLFKTGYILPFTAGHIIKVKNHRLRIIN
jgi:hypothetical protein